MLKIIEGYRQIYQGYLEVEVDIYDPEAFYPLTEDAPEEHMLHQLSERGFNQRIVWVRDEYLLIESLDKNQRPLHFYVFEPVDRRYSENLSSDRLFLEVDVEFPQLYFFTKHLSFFKHYLNRLSIAPHSVQIVQHDESFAYRLGDEKTNLIVDPDRFRILEINSELQISGRYYPMRIEFSDWDAEWNELPRKTRYFIKSRLFKEITVVYKQKHLSSHRYRFLEQYGAYLPPTYGFSLNTDYGR